MENLGLFVRKLYEHSGEPWEGNSIPLKADLIRLTQRWSDVVERSELLFATTSPPCPISFSEEEVEAYPKFEELQEEADAELDNLRGSIGINIDGWTPVERYEDAMAQAAYIKEKAIEYAESDFEREMTKAHWPLDDHDENEQISDTLDSIIDIMTGFPSRLSALGFGSAQSLSPLKRNVFLQETRSQDCSNNQCSSAVNTRE